MFGGFVMDHFIESPCNLAEPWSHDVKTETSDVTNISARTAEQKGDASTQLDNKNIILQKAPSKKEKNKKTKTVKHLCPGLTLPIYQSCLPSVLQFLGS